MAPVPPPSSFLPLPSLAALILGGSIILMYFGLIFQHFVFFFEKNEKVEESEEELKDVEKNEIIEEKEEIEKIEISKSCFLFLEEIPEKVSGFDGGGKNLKLFFQSFSEFFLILFYAFLCEWAPYFAHEPRRPDIDQYFFLFFIILVFGVREMKEEALKGVGFLGRGQTEEWKGWLQVLFLLYHYFHQGEVYNAVRVFVSCYVWMTGFGNFSYFYLKNDFSIYRLLSMLWRLNFLPLLLCLSLSIDYFLYYIVPLHTFYFLLCYVTMKIGAERGGNQTKFGMRLKLSLLGVLILLVWDLPPLFDAVFFFLPSSPSQGAKNGYLYEWKFRSGLDHWSAYLGMIFAFNFPNLEENFKKIESLPFKKHLIFKLVVSIILLGLVGLFWVPQVFMLEKKDYNMVHPYSFFIPMMAFIFFRNITPWFRSRFSSFLHSLGQTTLETYLLQHHVWMSNRAKSIFFIFPKNYPLLNFFFCSLIFLYLARRLFILTVRLRTFFISPDLSRTLRSLLWASFFLILSFLSAIILKISEGRGVHIASICFVFAQIGSIFTNKVSGTLLFQFRLSWPLFVILLFYSNFILRRLNWNVEGLLDYQNPIVKTSGPPNNVASNLFLGFLVLLFSILSIFLMDSFIVLRILGGLFGIKQRSWEDIYLKKYQKVEEKSENNTKKIEAE